LENRVKESWWERCFLHSVHHHGTAHIIQVPTSATLQDLSNELERVLNIPIENQTLGLLGAFGSRWGCLGRALARWRGLVMLPRWGLDSPKELTVHHHGTAHIIQVPTSATLQDLSNELERVLNIPIENQKLLIAPKPGLVMLPRWGLE
jgi:hypothetical protein